MRYWAMAQDLRRNRTLLPSDNLGNLSDRTRGVRVRGFWQQRGSEARGQHHKTLSDNNAVRVWSRLLDGILQPKEKNVFLQSDIFFP